MPQAAADLGVGAVVGSVATGAVSGWGLERGRCSRGPVSQTLGRNPVYRASLRGLRGVCQGVRAGAEYWRAAGPGARRGVGGKRFVESDGADAGVSGVCRMQRSRGWCWLP